MDIGNTLNVVISLVFIFLLLSMIASAVREMIAGAWNSRGLYLKRAIGQMLGDTQFSGLARNLYDHPLIAGLVPRGHEVRALRWLAPILPVLAARLPSYIPNETVVTALTDILRRANAFQTGTMQPGLRSLWEAANHDEAVFKTKLTDWYQSAMDRQSGMYKRTAQRQLFVIGLLIAIALNVNTLTIATELWDSGNTQRAAQIAAQASAFYAARSPVNGGVVLPTTPVVSQDGKTVVIFSPASVAPPTAEGNNNQLVTVTPPTPEALINQLKDTKVPMGWRTDDACAITGHVLPTALNIWPLSRVAAWACPPPPPPPFVYRLRAPLKPPITIALVLGWIVTAFAISLGAQFWFDALGKVLNLRATGVKPSPAPSS